MYYEHTITAIRNKLKEGYPNIVPKFLDLSTWGPSPVPSSYILWMCDEVEKMDTTSIKHAVKAGRWMGWILSQMEVKGYWNNSHSRNLTRVDNQNGFDLPHPK